MSLLGNFARAFQCFALAAAITAVMASPAAADINVNSQTDDGTGCTLREAVSVANAGADADGCVDAQMEWDTIALPAGTYTLTGAAGDNINNSGDLDIGGNLAILGQGPGVTTIDGNENDRVFEVGAGDLFLSKLRVLDGKAATGAGVSMSGAADGTLVLVDTVFESNEATSLGGAIMTDEPMIIRRTTFLGNTAGSDGGAIESFGVGLSEIKTSAFIGNSAGGQGGAIDAYSSALSSIYNSTFSQNSAEQGGAIYQATSATAGGNLVGLTVSGNSASISGGGLNLNVVTAVQRTIVAFNTGPAATGNCGGMVDAGEGSPAYNLTDSGCGFTPAEGDIVADPQLAPLGFNGGTTQTMPLYAGSPAIDAIPNAACSLPDTDQREVARPVGAGCDIGAFEGSIAKPLGPPSSTPPAATSAKKKKCKKGRKLKKGKCKKKKKRKK